MLLWGGLETIPLPAPGPPTPSHMNSPGLGAENSGRATETPPSHRHPAEPLTHRASGNPAPHPILTGMACWDCWGPRPHSEQECGCRHAGVSVNRNVGCGCLKWGQWERCLFALPRRQAPPRHPSSCAQGTLTILERGLRAIHGCAGARAIHGRLGAVHGRPPVG